MIRFKRWLLCEVDRNWNTKKRGNGRREKTGVVRELGVSTLSQMEDGE